MRGENIYSLHLHQYLCAPTTAGSLVVGSSRLSPQGIVCSNSAFDEHSNKEELCNFLFDVSMAYLTLLHISTFEDEEFTSPVSISPCVNLLWPKA